MNEEQFPAAQGFRKTQTRWSKARCRRETERGRRRSGPGPETQILIPLMHDDQFTALGPPFDASGFEKAAFSTGQTNEEDTLFEWGVRVVGRRGGVVGQAAGGWAGVIGQGRFSKFGVLGT